MYGKQVFTVYILPLFFIVVLCLEVIPERAGVVKFNKKYIKEVSVNVRRYSRNSPYVVNIHVSILQTLGNNVTIHFQFYEFLHNEYKRSFIDMNYRLCELINNDPYIGPVIKKLNVVCPLKPGNYLLPNLTLAGIPAVEHFPYQWPFEKGKAVVIIYTNPKKELVAEAYGILHFKQAKKPDKKITAKL